ncbi:Imm3 family immunity protein [Bacillus haynesii]|uniref:Imm3 family immunity protein n=1 Tax=Bacillus haynesii TaxID=1925021 RepID=UPI002281C6A3|nr:Imm3 family immunity protein [Bacillus haynesii]MCY8576210.1 Imm3 family immunity protein [Bacillus haynesii]MCY8712985.1 Imm3 family immunity protein [Bacillus haynesii]MCY8738617.1 Imm3 family immunity protein [Bacillus haynesii]MCY9147486.1 Imm3 family immunity protein [Bacillus haynesii]MCY9317056.1 Imm3 family immunity protein [Bacillus haynesii]
MKDWEYNELFDAIQETYEELLDEDRGYRYAIAKLADEFDNLGKIEDVIVDTAIGEILIGQDKVFVGRINGITNRLSRFHPQEAEGELTLEEIKDLSRRINKVIEGLKNVEVDYNPSAE